MEGAIWSYECRWSHFVLQLERSLPFSKRRSGTGRFSHALCNPPSMENEFTPTNPSEGGEKLNGDESTGNDGADVNVVRDLETKISPRPQGDSGDSCDVKTNTPENHAPEHQSDNEMSSKENITITTDDKTNEVVKCVINNDNDSPQSKDIDPPENIQTEGSPTSATTELPNETCDDDQLLPLLSEEKTEQHDIVSPATEKVGVQHRKYRRKRGAAASPRRSTRIRKCVAPIEVKEDKLFVDWTKSCCPVCYEKVRGARKRLEHMRQHIGEEPYRCGVCDAAFWTQEFLRQHTIVHDEPGMDGSNCIGDFERQLTAESETKSVAGAAAGEEGCRQAEYHCAFCDDIYIDMDEFAKHVKTHEIDTITEVFSSAEQNFNPNDPSPNENERPFECTMCEATFAMKRNLNSHIRLHFAEKSHVCAICGKGFKMKGNLTVHARTHIKDKLYRCTACNELFSDSMPLGNHYCSDRSGQKYGCVVCGKVFEEIPDLVDHVRQYTGEAKHSCPVCGKKFIESTKVKVHMRMHTGERPYPCPVCGKGFSESNKLKIHLRSHTGDKPYTCAICNAAFTVKCNLKKHMMRHTGEKPFVCDLCGHACTQRVNLNTHMLTHDASRVKPFECPTCSKRFISKRNLLCHQRSHSRLDVSIVKNELFDAKQLELPVPLQATGISQWPFQGQDFSELLQSEKECGDQKQGLLDKKDGYLDQKDEYLDQKQKYLNQKQEYLDQKLEYLDQKQGYLDKTHGYVDME